MKSEFNLASAIMGLYSSNPEYPECWSSGEGVLKLLGEKIGAWAAGLPFPKRGEQCPGSNLEVKGKIVPQACLQKNKTWIQYWDPHNLGISRAYSQRPLPKLLFP